MSDDLGAIPTLTVKKFTGYNLDQVPTISSIETKDDLATSSDSAVDEAEMGNNSPDSSFSPLENSIASSKTMRTKNTSEINALEKNWLTSPITPPRHSADGNNSGNQVQSKPPLGKSGSPNLKSAGDGAFPAGDTHSPKTPITKEDSISV